MKLTRKLIVIIVCVVVVLAGSVVGIVLLLPDNTPSDITTTDPDIPVIRGDITVSFDTQGGKTISPVILSAGSSLEAAPESEKANQIFIGWRYEDYTQSTVPGMYLKKTPPFMPCMVTQMSVI